jgi:hypothetical protein
MTTDATTVQTEATTGDPITDTTTVRATEGVTGTVTTERVS